MRNRLQRFIVFVGEGNAPLPFNTLSELSKAIDDFDEAEKRGQKSMGSCTVCGKPRNKCTGQVSP